MTSFIRHYQNAVFLFFCFFVFLSFSSICLPTSAPCYALLFAARFNVTTLMQKARIASSEKQKVTLSCEQCRQRKTRCDKTHPCASCKRSDLECTLVHRHRLARGRAGTDKTKDADLKDRVAKLENILVDWQSNKDSRTVQKVFYD